MTIGIYEWTLLGVGRKYLITTLCLHVFIALKNYRTKNEEWGRGYRTKNKRSKIVKTCYVQMLIAYEYINILNEIVLSTWYII